jgi:hypothetical protein
MGLNATFNNISVISWQSLSLIDGENQSTRRKPSTCRKSLANFIAKCCSEYTSPWAAFELTTLVVIGNDCTGSCKSNYHMITTTVTPKVCHLSKNSSDIISSMLFSQTVATTLLIELKGASINILQRLLMNSVRFWRHFIMNEGYVMLHCCHHTNHYILLME